VGDQWPQAGRIVNQEAVNMAVGWAPNRPKADPNGSGANRLDKDDILAPHRYLGSEEIAGATYALA